MHNFSKEGKLGYAHLVSTLHTGCQMVEQRITPQKEPNVEGGR